MDNLTGKKLETAKRIAGEWGWNFDELAELLRDGGGKGIVGCSAAQAADAIIQALIND